MSQETLKQDHLISIIIPIYNSEKYIEETINSINEQTYKNFKVYIINDFSNDNSLKILNNIKKNNIFIYNLKKNMGPAFCRNLGLRKSNSQYICFLDSDDLWHKNKLEKQINFMKKYNLNFSYTDYKTFEIINNIKREIKVPNKFNFNTFVKNTSIATSSIMVTRELINCTKFKKKGYGFDDYIFKCDMLKKKDIKNLGLSEYLTFYRIRPNSISSKALRNFYWIWRINSDYHRFGFFKNVYLILNISFNSIIKYFFKI